MIQKVSFDHCAWLNEPPHWSKDSEDLVVQTGDKTDFWRTTHYGFTHNSGHFLGKAVNGDFTAQIRFRANYTSLYDQAGLMLRIDENNWIKTGIEYTDGLHALSTVVTLGKSDWSVGHLPGGGEDVSLRLTLCKGAVRIQASSNGKHWPLFRLCPFPDAAEYQIGPMCCSPQRKGFIVRFSEFMLGPPTSKDLHDLT
jgi:regulation of enolase protein 1 (concanavalin A-like superfamily)